MAETKHLINQAARELQIAVEITTTASEPDLKTMEVINTYTVTFKDRRGDAASAEIKDGTQFQAVHGALATAWKAKKHD